MIFLLYGFSVAACAVALWLHNRGKINLLAASAIMAFVIPVLIDFFAGLAIQYLSMTASHPTSAAILKSSLMSGYMTVILAVVYAINFAGIAFALKFPWRKYIPVEDDTSGEQGVALVERLANQVCRQEYSASTPADAAIRWKMIAMGLRFSLFFLPKYLVIGLMAGSVTSALLASFVAALILSAMGLLYYGVYKQFGREKAPLYADLYLGGWFGIADIVFVNWLV